MRRLLLSLLPATLLHEFGTGRALDNARREYTEVAATMAVVDALAGRLEPALVEAAFLEVAVVEPTHVERVAA